VGPARQEEVVVVAGAREGRSLFWPAVLVVGVIQLVERRRTSPDPPRLALAGTLLLRRTRQPTP
jgi:hypothetical protein